MAKIVVQGEDHIVTLDEPDEEGDYVWTCSCGEKTGEYRPIDEAIAHAEAHVDYGAPG